MFRDQISAGIRENYPDAGLEQETDCCQPASRDGNSRYQAKSDPVGMHQVDACLRYSRHHKQYDRHVGLMPYRREFSGAESDVPGPQHRMDPRKQGDQNNELDDRFETRNPLRTHPTRHAGQPAVQLPTLGKPGKVSLQQYPYSRLDGELKSHMEHEGRKQIMPSPRLSNGERGNDRDNHGGRGS